MNDKLYDKEQTFYDNENLIWAIIFKNYRGLTHLYDDMYQVGVIGLLGAIENYDESKGQFSTIATHYIRGNIQNFITKESGIANGFSGYAYLLYRMIMSMKKEFSENEIWERVQEEFGDKVSSEMFRLCYARLGKYGSLDSMIEDGAAIEVEDSGTNVEREVESELMVEYYMKLCDRLVHRHGQRNVDIFKDYLSQKTTNSWSSYQELGDKWGECIIIHS